MGIQPRKIGAAAFFVSEHPCAAAAGDSVGRNRFKSAFARERKLNCADKRRFFADAAVVAKIIFKVFHAPRGKRVGVDRLMPQRRRIILAGALAVGGIDAELQTQRVDFVRQRTDAVRKSGQIGLQTAVFVAFAALPAVVKVHITVAGVGKAAVSHRFGDLQNERFIDVALKQIPARPPHRRRFCSAVAAVGRRDRVQSQLARQPFPFANGAKCFVFHPPCKQRGRARRRRRSSRCRSGFPFCFLFHKSSFCSRPNYR